MPLKHQSLPELLAHLDVRHSQHPPPAAASYNFRNTYFMDDMVPTEEQQRELPYKVMCGSFGARLFLKPENFIEQVPLFFLRRGLPSLARSLYRTPI